mmetsp:Transcript_26847/g.63695  ORF Transcript_26847/g.63695 Transcript_26847/m.63695 type:complete len:246 (+) Transcript_26847:1055-1792(+)
MTRGRRLCLQRPKQARGTASERQARRAGIRPVRQQGRQRQTLLVRWPRRHTRLRRGAGQSQAAGWTLLMPPRNRLGQTCGTSSRPWVWEAVVQLDPRNHRVRRAESTRGHRQRAIFTVLNLGQVWRGMQTPQRSVATRACRRGPRRQLPVTASATCQAEGMKQRHCWRWPPMDLAAVGSRRRRPNLKAGTRAGSPRLHPMSAGRRAMSQSPWQLALMDRGRVGRAGMHRRPSPRRAVRDRPRLML